jgi:hypothetical protein
VVFQVRVGGVFVGKYYNAFGVLDVAAEIRGRKLEFLRIAGFRVEGKNTVADLLGCSLFLLDR